MLGFRKLLPATSVLGRRLAVANACGDRSELRIARGPLPVRRPPVFPLLKERK